MRRALRCLCLTTLLGLSLGGVARAGDQRSLGVGNALAMQQAESSPLVQSARAYILAQVDTVSATQWREATRDAVANAQTCVAHRVGLTDDDKRAIVEALRDQGLVDPADDEKILGGLVAGVFPPVVDDGSACPHIPQSFFSAPGSVFAGHHSFPGGLAVHVAFNLSSFVSLADNYRRVYGHVGADGLPTVTPAGQPSPTPAASDLPISEDIAVLAPTWHDWGKILVFQWHGDGSEFIELNFGGNGKTDNFGAAGDSKTGGHHIIGLAETMSRGFPPEFIVTQASAHAAPTYGAEYKVVNWIRAAALMARVDPVERGYLARDAAGHLRLAPMRALGTMAMQDGLPGEPRLLVEYILHNLSDADYTFTGPAVTETQALLKQLAPRFGYDPADAAAYNTRFRNPVMSRFSAERLQILYANDGIEAVALEIGKLKKAGVI